MSVAHLEGKRTGRPKGARSAPPWRRDAVWAYRNLGNPEAVPPSELAARLVALGREHPDRLLAVLVQMDGAGQANGGPAVGAEAPVTAPDEPRRVKVVTLRRQQLAQFIFKDAVEPWMAALPDSFVVEEIAVHPKAHSVTLTIRSEEFEAVPEGQPVPRIELPQG